MSGFATARQKMVDGQMRPSDVTDIRILDAMLAVPREAFVPENKQALAYLDLDLDVSEGGPAKRFLITPEQLYRQLRDGGRLVGVFATSRPARATVVTASHGDFGHRTLFDAAAPVLPGMELVPAFVF